MDGHMVIDIIWISYELHNYMHEIDPVRQGFSQDYNKAYPKQQFKNLCPSKFSYSATSSSYTNYIW